MTNSVCSTCKFFDRVQNGSAIQTICRRHPPTVHAQFVTAEQYLSATLWPAVQAADSCGEHRVAIALTN